MGSVEGRGPQTDKTHSRKVPLQVTYFKKRLLPSQNISLICLRFNGIVQTFCGNSLLEPQINLRGQAILKYIVFAYQSSLQHQAEVFLQKCGSTLKLGSILDFVQKTELHSGKQATEYEKCRPPLKKYFRICLVCFFCVFYTRDHQKAPVRVQSFQILQTTGSGSSKPQRDATVFCC